MWYAHMYVAFEIDPTFISMIFFETLDHKLQKYCSHFHFIQNCAYELTHTSDCSISLHNKNYNLLLSMHTSQNKGAYLSH